MQNDVSNRHSPVTIVASITSQFEKPLYPTEVLVRAPEGGLRADSVVLLNQLRTVDRSRLRQRLGSLSDATMAAVNHAIEVSLGLVSLS